MADRCTVPAGCVQWPQPETWLGCDPCIDPANEDHAVLLDTAWASVTSFLYTEFYKLGMCWPGSCFEETFRPCLSTGCRCSSGSRRCHCGPCGIYNYIPLNETCLPVIDVIEMWIGPTHCNPDPVVYRPGDGLRLEWAASEPRLVLQRSGGCCPDFPVQDLCRPLGDPCTWHVKVRTGCDPPPHVLDGAMQMTLDLVKECVVTGCKLPGNVTRKSFDGTSVSVDPDAPTSLTLRMLERLLSSEAPYVENFYCPTPWSMHPQGGPVPSCCPCDSVCKSPCPNAVDIAKAIAA